MIELFKMNNIAVIYREHLIKENLQIVEDMINIVNNNHKEKLDKSKLMEQIAIESVRFSKLNNRIYTVIDSKALNKLNKLRDKSNKTEEEQFLLNVYSYLDYIRLLSAKEKVTLEDLMGLHQVYNNKKVKFRLLGKSDANILCEYKHSIKTDLNMKNRLDTYFKNINNTEIDTILLNIIYSWLIMYMQPFKENNIVLAYSNLWALLNKKLNKSVVGIFKAMCEYNDIISNSIISCEKLDKNNRLKCIDITEYINTMLIVVIESISEYNKSFEKYMITSMSKEDFLTRVRLSDKVNYSEMVYGLISGSLKKTEYGVEVATDNKDINGILINYVTK